MTLNWFGFFLDPSAVDDEGTMFLRKSGSTNPATQYDIPEDLSLKLKLVFLSSKIFVINHRTKERLMEFTP